MPFASSLPPKAKLLIRVAFAVMRTGIYLFLIWGVPIITTGSLLYLAHSRRMAPGRSADRK